MKPWGQAGTEPRRHHSESFAVDGYDVSNDTILWEGCVYSSLLMGMATMSSQGQTGQCWQGK